MKASGAPHSVGKPRALTKPAAVVCGIMETVCWVVASAGGAELGIGVPAVGCLCLGLTLLNEPKVALGQL